MQLLRLAKHFYVLNKLLKCIPMIFIDLNYYIVNIFFHEKRGIFMMLPQATS